MIRTISTCLAALLLLCATTAQAQDGCDATPEATAEAQCSWTPPTPEATAEATADADTCVVTPMDDGWAGQYPNGGIGRTLRRLAAGEPEAADRYHAFRNGAGAYHLVDGGWIFSGYVEASAGCAALREGES